ncbi:MAG: hypothetical protein Q7V88_11210 [Actinomycetota bacterium]|nr:hypothetical protein [Actinomycetota bacterium]
MSRRRAVTRIAIAVSAGALGMLAACSDSSSGGSGTTTTGVSATGTPTTGDDAGTTSGTDATGSATSTEAVTGATAGAGSTSSLPAGGSSSTVGVGSGGSAGTTTPGAAPDGTDPFASTPPPDPTELDEVPGPPMEGCIDAEPGPASVELTFDDDDIRYAGAVAPPCVRIHAPQQLVVRSSSGIAAMVSIGADAFPLAPNETIATAPLGAVFSVGDSFDVYVDFLDATVVVQVLP